MKRLFTLLALILSILTGCAKESASIGVIGGADGPTTIFMGQPRSEEPQKHIANSSLRFEHAKRIEWRIVFQEKPNEDYTVTLI